MLGLFRLWWIPQGQSARNGAYVYYNVDAMIAVLTIEATRAGGVVIGEDLGTVPKYVSKVLASHGVLGTVGSSACNYAHFPIVVVAGCFG